MTKRSAKGGARPHILSAPDDQKESSDGGAERVLARRCQADGEGKDQIAQWVLDHPDTAAWAGRDPAPVSGLPRWSA